MTAGPPLSISATLRAGIIERFLTDCDPDSVLEVGPGMGAMAHRLATVYEYRGYEPDRTSYEVARERLQGMQGASLYMEPLPAMVDRRFDAVVAFEVLEHLEDDVAALSLWRDWCQQGGHLILSVPAHPDRYGPWDASVGHFRRYSRVALASAMDRAGWELVDIRSWGMPIGYVLEGVRNLAARSRRHGAQSVQERTYSSGRQLQPRTLPYGLIVTITAPFELLQRPFQRTGLGIGYVALARRA